MSVLLFGYSPFLEFDENPSQLVAEKLDGQKIRDNEIKSIILPVDYSKVENLILDAINKYDPALIIGLGLAPGRSKAGRIKKYPWIICSIWTLSHYYSPIKGKPY